MKFISSMIPSGLKAKIKNKLDTFVRDLKAPRMVYGFQDSNGEWRPQTRVSDTVYFYHRERIRIANNAFVWHYSILDGTGGLEIGEGTQIGAWVGVFTHSSHISIRIYGAHYQEIPENEKKGYVTAPVKIGKYVFIAAGSKILPGVKIGDGALISVGSVVTKDVGNFEIVSGNPAVVIGDTRRLDARYLRDEKISSWYREWAPLEIEETEKEIVKQ